MTTKAIGSGAASDLVDLRARYALSRATLAEWLGVAEATLANWETKGASIRASDKDQEDSKNPGWAIACDEG
jgi:DNA-binding transcriptional regulator YiaG